MELIFIIFVVYTLWSLLTLIVAGIYVKDAEFDIKSGFVFFGILILMGPMWWILLRVKTTKIK